jgi:hypothetical protein
VLVVGKSLVIIEISALRASALAIFSAKWFKLEVLRDAKHINNLETGATSLPFTGDSVVTN